MAVTPNILHQYPSWTYNLALYPVPYGGFEGAANANGAYEFPPKKDIDFKKLQPIIASGYKSASLKLTPSYGPNFYFDRLTFKNTVANNANSKMANTTIINFSIIETFGVSLFDRLMETGNKSGYKVNPAMTPYALVIEFFAVDEVTGAPVAEICKPKVMLVKLGEITTKITTKGAEYQVQAQPYSQDTLAKSADTLPAAFSIEAETVNEFFGSYHRYLNGENGKDYSIVKDYPNTLSAALTKWQDKAVKDRTINKPNEYIFYFHPEIGNSKLLDADLLPHTMLADKVEKKPVPAPTPAGTTSNNAGTSTTTLIVANASAPTEITTGKAATVTSTTKQTLVQPATSQSAASVVGPQRGKCNSQTISRIAKDDVSTTGRKIIFQLNQGMSISDVITIVVCSSEYIRKQFTEPSHGESPKKNEPGKNKEAPLDWFKILPIVANLDPDDSMGTMSKRFEYTVDKFKIYQTKIPTAPMSCAPEPTKEYNYIYTGKNKDVLNFDLNFANLYKTYYNNSGVAVSSAMGPTKKPQVDDPTKTNETAENIEKLKGINPTTTPSRALTGTTDVHKSMPTIDAKGQTIADFYKTQLERSVDLLSVDLKIVGDPDFIKQDDIRYQSFWSKIGNEKNPGKYSSTDDFEGIKYDEGSVFIKVNFNTITDYSESGIAATNAACSFSGFYNILEVEHSFQGGRFEQTLKIVRHGIQETKIDPSVVANKT